MQPISNSTDGAIVALDVGSKRIGVAVASSISRLARPLTTLDATGDVATALSRLLHDESAVCLVVGLPRGLDGQDTAQTAYVRQFVAGLDMHVPIEFQDEALTSRKAEAELEARGKRYSKGDIDALAATYILEDYLAVTPERR